MNTYSTSSQYSQYSPYHPDLLPPLTEQELTAPTTGKRNRCYGGILYRVKEKEKQYLLVKGRQTGIWSFPKGHSNSGESPLECAIREIQEETGIHIRQEPIRAQRLKGGIYFVFHIEHDTEVYQQEDKNEIEETCWMTREEMEYMIVNSGVKDFLQRRVLI